MRKFFLKIVVFFLPLLILIVILNEIKIVPFYWGADDEMRQKIVYLLDNPNKHDVIFFGSSTTYRHIDPLLFDSITGYNSFNMGYAGVGSLESDYLIDNLSSLLKLDTTLHVIYLRRSRPGNIAKENLHSVKSHYFLDYKRYKIALKYFFGKGDLIQVYRYTVSYLENLFLLGNIKNIMKYTDIHISSYSREADNSSEQFRINHKGFFPLDIEFEITNKNALHIRREEYINSEKYLKDTVNNLDNMKLTFNNSSSVFGNTPSSLPSRSKAIPFWSSKSFHSPPSIKITWCHFLNFIGVLLN